MFQARIVVWATCIAVISAAAAAIEGVGVNWGTLMSHPMDPAMVVRMLKANGINKVKLFDADPWTVNALAGTRIEVMLAIPNDHLGDMSSNYENAKDWVKQNVVKHDRKDGVNIKYVAVGNEPFLRSYKGSFASTAFPALKNIQRALDEAGVGDRIKATIPQNADIYSSPVNDSVPSAGNFRRDIRALMTKIVRYLDSKGSPFVVNIYPYLSLYQDPNFPVDFAFFDGKSQPVVDEGLRYTNVFDANYDTLVWSLRKAGVPNMKILVGEIGWPTDGDKNANTKHAKRFYDGLLKKVAKEVGTPLRPGKMEVYLFGLIDEDMKSVEPGNFERHWGIFSYDGRPKFPTDFTGKGKDRYLVGATGVRYLPKRWCALDETAAKKKLKMIPSSVNYACSTGDCTPLGYGSSCQGLSLSGNISYAFNAYFQTMDQDVRACDFEGLGKVATTNLSQGTCLFPVQIVSAGERAAAMVAAAAAAAVAAAAAMVYHGIREKERERERKAYVDSGLAATGAGVPRPLVMGGERGELREPLSRIFGPSLRV
ncbi:glucan endo-1,3-beta-glucosidase 8-like [Phoenix dactylifera]|uniref:glucan endo-1,3-beta-D-glucosidase n=1 Tax=Phoenix dactylifera TaxID=42345 RepID=A0A8B9A3J2_PHODC|nr:glucan endo-1,3-beta-glucosidase 8-like [Phoenix dactylifera]